jgi:hypothetical protein
MREFHERINKSFIFHEQLLEKNYNQMRNFNKNRISQTKQSFSEDL